MHRVRELVDLRLHRRRERRELLVPARRRHDLLAQVRPARAGARSRPAAAGDLRNLRPAGRPRIPRVAVRGDRLERHRDRVVLRGGDAAVAHDAAPHLVRGLHDGPPIHRGLAPRPARRAQRRLSPADAKLQPAGGVRGDGVAEISAGFERAHRGPPQDVRRVVRPRGAVHHLEDQHDEDVLGDVWHDRVLRESNRGHAVDVRGPRVDVDGRADEPPAVVHARAHKHAL